MKAIPKPLRDLLRGLGPRWRATVDGLKRVRVSRRAALLVLVIGVVVGGFLQRPPNTMLSASVQSEVVELQVVNAAASTFTLAVARLTPSGNCHTGIVVKPEVGARVIYARPRRESLTVSVVGPAVWSDAAQREQGKVARSLDLVFDLNNQDVSGAAPCKAGQRVRLPIQGIVTFGSDLAEVRDAGADQLTLLSGKLLLYGRAIPAIFGFVPLDAGPFKANALYFSQEIPLPGGSRIASATIDKKVEGAAADNDSRWYGFADISFSEGDPGAMFVEASTNARFVELYTPAPFRSYDGDGGYRPDIISLSLGARLTGDPNLLWIYGLIAFIVTLLGLGEFFRREGDSKP